MTSRDQSKSPRSQDVLRGWSDGSCSLRGECIGWHAFIRDTEDRFVESARGSMETWNKRRGMTPMSAELAGVYTAACLCYNYLSRMQCEHGQELVQLFSIELFCDNLNAAELAQKAVENNAWLPWIHSTGAHHLEPLCQLLHDKFSELLHLGIETIIISRNYRGRKSRKIGYCDHGAKDARWYGVPIDDCRIEVRGGMRRSIGEFQRRPREEQKVMMAF